MTLSFDPDALELPFYHFIGGERVQAGGGLEMRRPSDGKAYGDCPVADAAMVDRAVATAKEAQKASGWADARPRERLNAMHRWADLMQEEAVTLARLEAVSSTRPIAQLIDGDIADGVFRAEGVTIGGLQKDVKGPVTLGFRAEDASLAGESGELAADVYSMELLGEATMASFRIGSKLVSIKSDKTYRAGIGERIRAAIPAGICHLFDARSGARLSRAAGH